MADLITCPSGLSGTLRGMKVREERILVDRKLAKSGGQLDELLAACWVETVDPGPYAFDAARPDWGAVLQGDRFYALLQLRAVTYGPEYSFAVTCREPRCRARIEWELDLRDLPVRPLSEASRETFVGGNRFPAVLPDAGTKVVFKLLTGADERRLPALRQKAGSHLLSATLAYRLVEIDGVKPKDTRRFVDDLSLADVRYLGEAFERADCGVETSIDVECQACFAVQAVALPFDADFFLPTTRPRSSPTSTSRRGERAPSDSSGDNTEALDSP